MGTQPYRGWRGVRTRSSFRTSPITQTQRPVVNGTPDGNRTHISRISPVVLSQLNYGVIRWTSGAIERRHPSAGNRTRTAKAFTTDGTPSLLLEDNRSTSAHQKLG